MQMPEMDGIAATQQICAEWADDRRPRLIAMTASAMQGDRQRCLNAGMNDYIAKPIQIQELITALSRCCPLVLSIDSPSREIQKIVLPVLDLNEIRGALSIEHSLKHGFD